MTAITKGRATGLLAIAQIDLLIAGGFKAHGFGAALTMGSVTKGLRCTFAASAPPIDRATPETYCNHHRTMRCAQWLKLPYPTTNKGQMQDLATSPET